ncbi:MAG TPA: alpha/beta hydrolase [Propionibacteriaceae bacterium]
MGVATGADAVGFAAGSSVVTLGGRQVHLSVAPAGEPTVLLLGGCGVPSYVWDDTAAQLGDLSVVRLDRPGLLDTPWPGRVPQLDEEIATLIELVERIETPVVVVAHSMAGLHAEALVRRHPAGIAGLVLVDGSVEWDPKRSRTAPVWLPLAHGVREAMRIRPVSLIGSLADRVMVAAQSTRRRIWDPVSEVAQQTYRRGDTVASVIAEQAAYGAQVADLAGIREGSTWPGTPTVVLTAAGDGGSSWVADQRRLAGLLTGRQVVIDDSRHLIMIDRPDLVVDAVRSFLEPKADRD